MKGKAKMFVREGVNADSLASLGDVEIVTMKKSEGNTVIFRHVAEFLGDKTDEDGNLLVDSLRSDLSKIEGIGDLSMFGEVK